MKRLFNFIKNHSSKVQSIFKKIAISLLIYSGFRFLTRNNLIYYDFILDLVYSPVTETLFFIALFSAIIFAVAKYLILKKPLF